MFFPLVPVPVLDSKREAVQLQAGFVRGEALYTTLPDHPALIVFEEWLPYQIHINKNSVHFSQQSPK